MFFTTAKRVIQAGFTSFLRNSFVSFATVFIMTITLLTIGGLIFANALLNSTLDQVRDKVDVNVYFSTTAPEEEIFAVQEDLEALPEVAFVAYTSREEALENFRERHEGDDLTLQALEELEENPLGASLSIKATDPSEYEGIANFLADDPALSGEEGIIEEINYFQNQLVIERLNDITNAVERGGLVLALILAIASIVIAFNTIRLAIYSAREEIRVMRLVGASNAFARGPFIVEGALYGLVSAIVTLIILYPAAWYLASSTQTWFEMSLLAYYISNFIGIFFIIVLSGVLLGVISSFLAVQKYLKI